MWCFISPQLWSDYTVLTFERVYGTGEDVDIRIDFSEPYIEHGDDLPFDGPGHVLAHAFLPWFSKLKGDVHFDDGETWTHESYSGLFNMLNMHLKKDVNDVKEILIKIGIHDLTYREHPLHSCVIANKRGHSRSIPHSINDLV